MAYALKNLENNNMGFLSKIFGQNDMAKVNAGATIRATIRSDINISDALAAHVNWKERLERYLNGTSEEELDPMVICRDDQCALGKWIHGPALNYFHGDADFHKLRTDHANFHYVAGNVVKKMQEHDKEGANTLLKNEYERTSREVINDLTELNKQLDNM